MCFNLLSAVNFIHEANVLHRDLKPDNVMINDDLEITLVDFGHSRTNPNPNKYLLSEIAKFPTKSKTENKDIANWLSSEREDRKKAPRNLSPHVYSRVYRPPEVVLVENEYSFSADIWSIGCILFELLLCQSFYESSASILYLFPSTSC